MTVTLNPTGAWYNTAHDYRHVSCCISVATSSHLYLYFHFLCFSASAVILVISCKLGLVRPQTAAQLARAQLVLGLAFSSVRDKVAQYWQWSWNGTGQDTMFAYLSFAKKKKRSNWEITQSFDSTLYDSYKHADRNCWLVLTSEKFFFSKSKGVCCQTGPY